MVHSPFGPLASHDVICSWVEGNKMLLLSVCGRPCVAKEAPKLHGCTGLAPGPHMGLTNLCLRLTLSIAQVHVPTALQH